MQKILKRFLTFTLALVMCLGITATVHTAVTDYVVADAATASEYYSGITAQGGAQLLGQLHDLITSSRTKYSSYDDCKATNAVKTDPGSGSNTVMEFYTHIDIDASKWDVSGGWNREHVWPKADSNGLWSGSNTTGGGADLHHIRPAEKDLNNSRGSMKYGEVTGGTEQYTSVSHVLGGHSTGSSATGTFEPLDNVKGDVARILMYVYTHYNNYTNAIFGSYATKNGSDVSGYNSKYFGTLNFTHIITASSEDAAKALLLKWNKSDPVDQIERTRNEAVYKIQGNRNPFIDNESYADAIWGGGTVVDPPVIDPTPSPTLNSISLSATALNLNVGETHNLTVTPNPSNATASVIWTSSNTSVAMVSGGTVTAKGEGTATITATSTVNASIKATATVTVKKASSSETTAGKVTILRKDVNASGGYGTYSWSLEGSIGGTAYVYGGNSSAMQFNTNKQPSQYIASDKPTPGAIRKVTVKCGSGSNNTAWKLLTSDQPYSGITSGNPTADNENAVSGEIGTWTVSGNDTYFALVLGGSGVSYVESIEIEYETVAPSEAFHNAVEAINGDDTLTTWRTTLNAAINAYKNLTDTDKTEVAADIAKLDAAIASYNKKVKAYNDADKVALKGAGAFIK